MVENSVEFGRADSLKAKTNTNIFSLSFPLVEICNNGCQHTGVNLKVRLVLAININNWSLIIDAGDV